MSLKRDIGSKDENINKMVLLFTHMARKYDAYEVFNGLLDYGISEYCLAAERKPMYDRFLPEEITGLALMLNYATDYVRERANLWTGDNGNVMGWGDPFGALFEAIAGDMKKQAQGLFFTPEVMCAMMAALTISPNDPPGRTMLEPTCGSGRLVLAANAKNPGIYFCANDIDAACAKMTALNMCLNGAVGQVTCMDGLWPTDENFRFGYQVVPLQMLLAMTQTPISDVVSICASIATAGQFRKMYALEPITFGDCWIGMGDGSQVDRINNQRADRAAAGTPTLNSLFTEVLPTGTQGKLF